MSVRLAFLVALLTFTTVAAHAQAAGHEAGEEEAVLAAMDQYMHAISNDDPAARAAMQMPDGMIFAWRPSQNGGFEVRSRSYARATGTSQEELLERYWSPTVLVRGGIAMVWAPYEFWVDGQTSHCGVDVFTFVRADGVWRVAGSMYTVEPDACAELRPADPTSLRPRE
jgi:hypothetical protein